MFPGTGGSVLYDGIDVMEIPPFNRRLGFVYQDHGLFPHMKVYDNIVYGLKMHGFTRAEQEERAYALMAVSYTHLVRLIRTAFEASDRRLEFIAQTLGASPWKCFLTILLPLCRGSLTSAFILTWSRALGEFGATLMLVGVTRFKTETLPGSIYLSISTGNNPTAMATAMLMLMISGCTLALAQVLGKSPYGRERQVGH